MFECVAGVISFQKIVEANMKKGIFFALIFLMIVNFSRAAEDFAFKFSGGVVEILLDKSTDLVKFKRIQMETFRLIDEASRGSLIVADFNFDGYSDIAILREMAIEKYYDIYLFYPDDGGFKLNTMLSNFPCPLIDKKSKKIIASCFHGGGCESWEEIYQYKRNSLYLFEKNGTSCDPGTGKIFKYRERYDGGKLIRRSVSR